ncbi:MAG: methyltransferase domain-containing protein [Rhodospirillaceae bacterium]|nr:methyltransferase domain-containing protein [Rhodospirillaceae bacterium]
MNDAKPQAWDPKRAAAWDKWFPILEDGAQVLSDRMVALAGIGPGDRVLDVATGLGEPAATAARAVGGSGHVDGVDLSAGMLDFAQRRADRLGLTNLSFREADANALEVPEQPYDAILCRWGLMFMQDLKTTLQSFHALLKPGGRVVAAIWGPPEDAPALSMGNRIVLSALDLPPPNEGAGTPFALSDVDAATKTFGESGFRDVSGEWLPVTYTFESVDEFIQFRRERSKPLEDRIAHFPSAKRDAAWQKVAEAARTFADTAGAVRMTNKAYVIAARR